MTWFDSFKTQAYELTDEIKGVFEEIGKLTPDNITNYNKDGWEPFIKNANVADKTLVKFLNDANQTDKSLDAFKKYPDVVNKTGKAFNFAALGAKALTVAMNVAVFFAITKVIEGVAWAVDQWVNRIEIAKEAMFDARDNFESVSSELESINKELDTNRSRIAELNSLSSLTYVEQGELDKLKEVTKELERQRDIKNIELKRAAEDLSNTNRNAFDKEYGDDGFSYEDVKKLESEYGSLSLSPTVDVSLAQEGLEGIAAALLKVKEARADAESSGDDEWVDSLLEREDYYKKQLEDNLSTLQEYRGNLNEIMNYRDLTEDEQKFYDNLEQGMRLIYQFTDPSAWNQIEFDQIFNGDSIDTTKEELIELAKAGKLDEDALSSYTKLNDAVKETDFILSDGRTAAQSFIDQIKALADESEATGESISNSLTKQEVIANINSLSEGFESLDKIMKSISDKDNPFDYALLDDTKFKDNFDGLGKSYTDFIETVSNSPKDIGATQSAFNDLITAWIDSEDVLAGLTDETANLAVNMLQNMGVANAEEVVMNRLALAHAEVAAEKYYNANASDSLNNATIGEVNAFVDEGNAAGISRQALSELALQKLAVNNVKIDTSSDVDQVIALANAAGASATVLSKLAQAKSIMAKAEAGALNGSVGDLRQYEYAQAMLSDIENGTFDFQTTLDPEKYKKAVYSGGTKTNKNGGSGSKDKKDTSKDIDWIDRQLKLLDDKRTELLNKSNDTYIDYLGITRDQFNRAQELFNSDLEAMPSVFDELGEMARSAGMTIAELYSLIANGFSGESRQSYLEQTLEVDKEALVAYGDAVQKYQEEYDKSVAKISSQYRAKIENGDLSIDTLSGDESEEVQKAITDYDKLNETKKAQYEKQKQYLDDIAAKYDNISASIQNENKQLENSNSVLEKQIEYYKSAGIVVDSSLYNKLSQNTAGQINNTRALLANKRAELQDMVSNGAKTSSEEYINLKGEISDAEVNIYALKKAQEDYNNMLLQLPIDNLATIVSMFQDIGSAISDWGAEYEASGKKLNAEYYQSMISNSAKVTDSLQKQASLIEDTMSNYDVGSDRYLELYKQLRSVNSEMSTAVQNMRKFNEEMLKLPLENIGGFSSELQKVVDGLSGVQSEYDRVISAVTGAIKNRISELEKQRDLTNETAQIEIDALNEKLKLLDKENEYNKLIFDLERKQYDLERARNQNTNRVIRNGETVYESDQSDISEAQQNLLDSQANLDKYNLQQQIDDAQKALDIFNEGIEKQVSDLQSISDKWSEISEKITQAQNEATATGVLGRDWQSKILSGNDQGIFNMFQNLYATNAESLKKYEDQLESTNNIESLLSDYIESYQNGTISYEAALKGINNLLSQLNKSMSASTNLDNILDYLSTTNGTEANADAVLIGIQTGLKDTATELLKSLEQYNKNSGMISEYTSSWQQLTDNVASMLDVMKEVRDNLRDSLDDRDDEDDNDNTRYGGGKDGSPGTPGRGEYVNSGPGVSRKDGITRGLIGSTSDSDREASMKLLGLKKLDPDEVPAVLHMGEAVFNEEQQKNLLNNFASAQRFVPNMKVPNYSNLVTKSVQPVDIHVSYGDLSFPNVRNVDDAFKEMFGSLEMSLRQSKSKFMK